MYTTTVDVRYTVENELPGSEFVDVLHRSGLAARRPVGDPGRITAMLRHANLIVCARDEAGKLIGVVRSLTDFAFCCYLSDLAVDRDWQGRGEGHELMRRTHEAVGGAVRWVRERLA